jgi:mannose-6-phosphate isomerase-like protein (cupin superfamily)
LTGIDEQALQYLENTTQKDQVIYWDKIEKISQCLKMPFSRFLELAEGSDGGYFYHATAHDRALIDYRHFLGVRIKSSLYPGPQNRFQIAEMYIDPKGGIRRASWQRKDDAKISAYVEDGELLVEVGKNRKTSIREGESIYFDGSLGYIFTNTGTKPAKLLFASYPPIIF